MCSSFFVYVIAVDRSVLLRLMLLLLMLLLLSLVVFFCIFAVGIRVVDYVVSVAGV